MLTKFRSSAPLRLDYTPTAEIVMPAPLQDRVVKFGVFELDLKNRNLRRHGIQLKLQEQPYQVLVVLLEHSGEVVAREDIRQRLWPSDTFVDFNNSVNAAVNRLREVLGDSADNPRFIETIPRRGYRFIAPIAAPVEASYPVAISLGKNPAIPNVDTRQPQKSWRWRTLAVSAAIGLVIAAISLLVRQRARDNLLAPEIHSLIVLPLENISGDPSQDYFASGMTEELTTRLAQIPKLRVISRTSAQSYFGVKKPASQIAKELNVDAIVEGGVMRSGQHVRISAQLIYAPADRHLWAQTYDRDLRDVLELQEEISSAVARQIQLKLQDRTAQHGQGHSINPEAFDLYLQARYHSNYLTRDDTDKAIALLERVIGIDSTFAPGFSELSRAYRQKAFYFSAEPEPWQERAYVSVEKALALDPNLADAHLAHGFLLWSHYQHFAHEAAIKEYQRALEIDPNLDEAHHQLGNVFVHIGLLDRALDEMQKAIALNPENALAQFHLAVAEEYSGKYSEALKGFERTKDFANPSLWTFEIASTLYRMGQTAEAASMVTAYISAHSPDEDGGLIASMNAIILASRNQPQEAQRYIDVARATQPKVFIHFHHTAYNIAAAYALLGRPGDAMPWLEQAVADGFPCYPLFNSDRSFDPIRSNPEFKRFMTDLREEWLRYDRTF
jgi:TolB-like protein/DNA-binding winged helix-turn-helix (wHTH) protein